MKKEITVKIEPDGSIYFLYHDDSFLKGLGEMQVTRASNVEWDVDEQKWVVWVISPEKHPFEATTPYDAKASIKRKRLQESFENRADAIAAEISLLNKRLQNGADVAPLFIN